MTLLARHPITPHNRGVAPNEITVGGGAIPFEELAQLLAKCTLEKKAKDVVIIDMRNLVSYTDAFVLCTASNRRQVQAIADEVRRVAKQTRQLLPKGVEGQETARWVLVDFGDVVVHVFDGPMRGFYDLDGLWADAPRLPTPEFEGETDDTDDSDAIFSFPR